MSNVLRGVNSALETVGVQSSTLASLGGAPDVDPLGETNRARKEPYLHSAHFRGRFDGCPIHEPAGD